jgi:hypothetical protein
MMTVANGLNNPCTSSLVESPKKICFPFMFYTISEVGKTFNIC